MSFTSKVSRGFAWNQLSKVLEFVLAFLLSIVIARGLETGDYGIYATILSVCSLAILFSSLGADNAINIYLPKIYKDKGKAAYLIKRLLGVKAVAGFCFCLMLITFSGKIGSVLLNDEITSYVKLAVYYVFFSSVSTLLMTVFIGLLRMRLLMFVRVGVLVFKVILAYVLLRLGYGIAGLILILTVGSVVSVAIYTIGSRDYIFEKSAFLEMKPIYKFGITLWLIAFISYALGKQIDILLMNRFLRDSNAIGYYNIAFGLVVTINSLLTKGFGGVALSAFSEAEAGYGRKGLARAWELTIKIQLALIIPTVMFFTYHAKSLISSLYSSRYLPSTILFQVFAAFSLTNRVLGGGSNVTVLYAINKERIAFWFRLAVGLLNLGLDVLLIPRYGAMGAIIATGSSGVVIIFLELLVTMKYLQSKYPLVFMFKIMMASLGALIAIMFIPVGDVYSLVGAGLVYCLAGTIILYILKPLEKQDTDLVLKIDRRLYGILRQFTLKHD